METVNPTEAHLMDLGWMVREGSRPQFLAEADSLPEDGNFSLVAFPKGRITYFDYSSGFTQDTHLDAPLAPHEFAKAVDMRHPYNKNPEPGKPREFLVVLTDSNDGTPVLDPAPFARYHELDQDPVSAPNSNPGHYVVVLTPEAASEMDGSVTNDEHDIASDILL